MGTSIMTIPAAATYLERNEPTKNMARFYAMSLEVDLFGSVTLRRQWGRIGQLGQGRAIVYDTEEQALDALHALTFIKRKRGYNSWPFDASRPGS
jgi:predicted DNA-binding WGR domain protein